jgi:glutaryl-CoA dehydrogenase
MAFKGVDYYAIEELFAEEEILVRDTVREWVERRAMPIIGQCFEEARFPRELVPELAQLGLLGATLPQEYDCAGINAVAYGLALQELERCDSGIRSFVSVQGALSMYPIFAFGTEDQRRRWLPPMARGEVIGCYGLTEADGGSDPAAMRTRAVREGDGFRLSGAKMWITNGSIADIAVVWAKIEEDGRDTIRGFLVERGTPGFSAPEIKRKHSLRASVTSELVFDDVALPPSSLLPGVRGLRGPFACLTQARYGIAWGGVGAAMACLEEAREFAASRRSFGAPIARKQLVQAKLVSMLAEITKCQLLCWRLGRLKDAQRVEHQQVSLAKRECVALALSSARLARDILGANGITAEYQAMRHLCNLESVITYEGTHDIHTLIVGESITGERAF